MDNDNLFESFDINTSSPPSQQTFLSKKHSLPLPTPLPLPLPSLSSFSSPSQLSHISFTKQILTAISTPSHLSSLLNDTSSLKTTSTSFVGGIHETIYPSSSPPPSLHPPSTPPATTFPFELDAFQRESILCIENNQSVLVAAHTSAGKTAVAQYAIALALQRKQRVVYTSPIKALSNQKYRELSHQFKDVGLMTGDVTLNADASCIVMTTEILRNMLYKGSELTKEVAWVVFDEVHYMRDRARGVVWEETMILLSNKIKYVFLSATIPNAREFAMWICSLKNQPCNVVYTEYRPVPLRHYVYASGSSEIYLAVDEKGNFSEENFNKALTTFSGDVNSDTSSTAQSSRERDVLKLLELINDHDLTPAIVFIFSKSECKELAVALSKVDFTSNEEKQLIERIYLNAMMTLSQEDQQVKQIQEMLPLLKKGVGMHHSGMLPIVRECVELIFQEGLLKVLFATETFAMGVNMPAKTVVFSDVEKFDGVKRRTVSGGEFIQMSGRAGRRGLDERGITILLLKKRMLPDTVRSVLTGASDALNSSFALSYGQILNLSRIEGVTSEFILKRSFRQFQAERMIPLLKKEIQNKYEKYCTYGEEFERDDCIQRYLKVKADIKEVKEWNRKIITMPKYVRKYLQVGRVVILRKWGIGVVVNVNTEQVEKVVYSYNNETQMYNKKKVTCGSSSSSGDSNIIDLCIVDMLVYTAKVNKGSNNSNNCNSSGIILSPGDLKRKNGCMNVLPFLTSSILAVSPIQISLPKALTTPTSLFIVEKTLFDITNKFSSHNIPTLDPIKDMCITDKQLRLNLSTLSSLNTQLTSISDELRKTYNINVNNTTNSNNGVIQAYHDKATLTNEMKLLLTELNALQRLVLQEELTNMKRVLRRLDMVKSDVVTLKGQVACCISSGDELILTEMIFNGTFNELDERQLCAVLSCFLSTEGVGFVDEQKKVNDNKELMKVYDIMISNAERVADVLIESQIVIDKEKYMKRFKCDYMCIMDMWCEGERTFGEICNTTTIHEGNIVRMIRRLDELLKELCEAIRVIGNWRLVEKMERVSKRIKRGLPFAASLYLSSTCDIDIWPLICKIKKLFEYYCQYGNRLNVNHLKSFHYVKLLRDSGVISSDNDLTHNMDDAYDDEHEVPRITKTQVEIIYKSENTSNTMTFNQFLNAMVKISKRKYIHIVDKKQMIYHLLTEHLIPLYDHLFHDITQPTTTTPHNVVSSSSLMDVKDIEDDIHDITVRETLIQTAPIFFEIYKVYFPHERSICENMSYIKQRSLKQYFLLLKELDICPGMITRATAFTVYQSETSNANIDKLLNRDKEYYFTLIRKIDLEKIIQMDSKNLNILGQFFNFFKFLRTMLKFADVAYREIELQTKESMWYNKQIKNISDKFLMLLKKIEKSDGFVHLEMKTAKTHGAMNASFTSCTKKLKRKRNSINNSNVNIININTTRSLIDFDDTGVKSKRSASLFMKNSMNTWSNIFGVNNNNNNNNNNISIGGYGGKGVDDIVVGRSFMPEPEVKEVDLIVYHNNYVDLCECSAYVKERYGDELKEIFVGVCQYGDVTNRNMLRSQKWQKMLNEAKLICCKGNNSGRNSNNNNSGCNSNNSSMNIKNNNGVKKRLLKQHEVDIMFTKLATIPIYNDININMNNTYYYPGSLNISCNTLYKVPINSNMFITFNAFIVAIEILAKVVYASLPTKDAIDLITSLHVFPYLRKYKHLKQRNNTKVQRVLNFENCDSNNKVIRHSKISLLPLFKYFNVGSDVMVFQQFLTFTKEFEVFPQLVSYNFLNEMFHIMSELSGVCVDGNVEVVDFERFCSLVYMCAFELKFGKDDIRDEERVLFIIDKFATCEEGINKMIKKGGFSGKRLSNGETWVLNANLKKAYPERYKKKEIQRDTFINIFS